MNGPKVAGQLGAIALKVAREVAVPAALALVTKLAKLAARGAKAREILRHKREIPEVKAPWDELPTKERK